MGLHTGAVEGPPRLEFDAAGRATVTLARPRHHNRLHREDLLALQDHFKTVAAAPAARLLVLTARGPSFCAGFHLGELGAGDGSAEPQLFERTVDALEALPLPTVARLNGSVYGGATDLALACDFRIGVAGMELRMPAARLGLHYYPGGLRRYVSRLGLGAAKRLFLLAEAVAADELLRIGYLDECVGAEALDARIAAYAAALEAGAPLAVKGMKASLDEIARGDFDLPRLREREALCAGSADLREGLAAYAAKRAPHFSGS
ncbi:Enoyl-CoA hydratase/isomerase family protein [Rubrivivax sp. A210]|uniref:enoyl-CoA hydratase/isomerase family protein n=1 Tax=Rubrivivax sp. A210 TaxID=2772301 RepID=UPI00191AA6F4|nr:enoyl-CoA hydratase/isomerase family protein [Rubrivivax sp. A210]CAD5372441.1 Enoyl-CoA hydratase/isomerase family protein [Rubrivivax sp. A210]